MIYEEYTDSLGSTVIKRTNEDGSISFIPMDEGNSDYQEYLKRDEAEQSTPIVIDEAETK